MKSLQDALYNWLTIKVVSDARPDDYAAKDTYQLFNDILVNTHHVSDIVIHKDDVMYQLTFKQDNEAKTARFPVELIDCILEQIQSEPEKYKNYPK
ncbi:hypothetical protein EJF36_08405 [Bacillus sp. HMF5848]|uniref:hypothetical protein n=1 Tax=Bacillus sp. HMF5848 TaxID=2495421 RepID=UPI000F7B9153|nr:hypothetical protein [Bacillus sp. HMF5848]RSK26886.1 hypothetical protein EJF36_08405 [Bacillus sp. HMF5848]